MIHRVSATVTTDGSASWQCSIPPASFSTRRIGKPLVAARVLSLFHDTEREMERTVERPFHALSVAAGPDEVVQLLEVTVRMLEMRLEVFLSRGYQSTRRSAC